MSAVAQVRDAQMRVLDALMVCVGEGSTRTRLWKPLVANQGLVNVQGVMQDEGGVRGNSCNTDTRVRNMSLFGLVSS